MPTAGRADSAASADHAADAQRAEHAETATRAGSAAHADSATKATDAVNADTAAALTETAEFTAELPPAVRPAQLEAFDGIGLQGSAHVSIEPGGSINLTAAKEEEVSLDGLTWRAAP